MQNKQTNKQIPQPALFALIPQSPHSATIIFAKGDVQITPPCKLPSQCNFFYLDFAVGQGFPPVCLAAASAQQWCVSSQIGLQEAFVEQLHYGHLETP